MAAYISMPKFGLTMEEGTLVEWLVKEGDKIEKGDPVAEVSTEKISNIIEAPASGIFKKILIEPGETVPVLANLGIIAEEGEEIDTVDDTVKPEAAEQSPAAQSANEGVQSVQKADVPVSHLAKKLAEREGVDLSQVMGTGPLGAVTKEDIQKYIANRPAKIAGVEVKDVEKPWTEMRKVISQRMMTSMSSSAQTSMTMEIDVTKLVDQYGELKAKYQGMGTKLSYTGIIVKAAALALKEHPILMTSGEEKVLKTPGRINIGLAVDINEGLVVPVIKDAGEKNLAGICSEIQDMSQKARENRLGMEETQGGVFTVSNLGMLGIKHFTPILNHPESALLGVGTLEEKVMIINGGIYIRSVLTVTLTHDHRIVDGAPAARFLNTLKELLSDPGRIVQ
ncbi:MAG: 2-oxo acid dehydrogenase subunit E2 [Clostridia bacterium]|nr:2-oxo acid dehydrogenase subunit E2 [Clostridia bacterium]